MGGGGGRSGLVQAIRRDRGQFRRFDRMAVLATSTLLRAEDSVNTLF